MSQLQQLHKQIAELDPVEREQLVFSLFEKMFPVFPFMFKWLHSPQAQDYPSIVTTTGVCGGAARLIRTRIPIWTLERMRQLGFTEIDILRSYPTLRAVDLVEAWWYTASHRHEIEQAIRDNEKE